MRLKGPFFYNKIGNFNTDFLDRPKIDTIEKMAQLSFFEVFYRENIPKKMLWERKEKEYKRCFIQSSIC